MSLQDRISTSKHLEPQEKLILGLLANEPMTARQIIDCVVSEPYELSLEDAYKALEGLQKKKLLELENLRRVTEKMDVEVYLTFTDEWVFRI